MVETLVVLRSGDVYFVVSSSLAASDKYDVCELVAQWHAVGPGGYSWHDEQGNEVCAVEHMILGSTLRHIGIPLTHSVGTRFDVREFVREEFGYNTL